MPPVISDLAHTEIPAACALFEQVFAAPITPAQWAWKYADGPRLGAVNLVARDDNGQFLGHAGASVFAGVAGTAPLAMAQVCDVMVVPAARSGVQVSSVYSRLMLALQAALSQRFANPYAYGFAGIRPFKLGQRLGYYRELHACRPGYLPTSPAPRTPLLWAVRPAHWQSPARLDAIWARLQASSPLPRVARTAAYLRWRYTSNPNHCYQLWVVRRLGQDRGWFITREMPNGDTCVVDALLPPSVSALHLAAALAQARQKAGWGSTPLFGWFLPADPTLEPVVGSEVRLTQWHTHLPNPQFHPGDTDVF